MNEEICAVGTKGCRVCGETKPLTAFYWFAGRPSYRCKACEAAYGRQRRLAGLTQPVDRARYQDPAGAYRAKQLRNARKWKARNPEKVRAQRVVDNEVRKGRVIRQPCEVCGARAQAHHADYGQPLAVQWLCPLHHARQHVAEGRLDAAQGTKGR